MTTSTGCSGCGAHGTGATPRASTNVSSKSMSSTSVTSGAGTSATSSGTAGLPVTGTGPDAASAGGDIVALNPSDGLFLRAEHLKVIQSYARELAMAVGIGSGTGVVYGFDITFEDTLDGAGPALVVSPGLAISAVGRPLRSSTSVVVSLSPSDLPEVGPDGFWVVEVKPAQWNFGNENVYGNLCDDPCGSAGSAIAPWTAEGITVSLRADDLPGLSVVEPVRHRNWLASHYFERERNQGGPWVVPTNGPGTVDPIQGRDWTKGAGAPVASGVPIGVIQLVGDSWILDVWTARRDIGGPPAENTWRNRLAMRPWNVFIAQVLQFQNQVAATAIAKAEVERREIVDERDEPTERFIEQMSETPVARWTDYKEFVSSYRQATRPYVLVSDGRSLLELGFDELPPAGYLGGITSAKGVATAKSLRARLQALFGEKVDLRLCAVRADYVAGAVEEAQHLDRIPLDSQYDTVAVDILVPVELADLPGLRTEAYRWVAFTRRREAHCQSGIDDERDLVEVYLAKTDLDELMKSAREGRVADEAQRLGELEYPAGGWDYPGGDLALDVGVSERSPVILVAVASTEERRPLAALRASLFAASFDEGAPPPRVWSVAAPAADAEAIVVLTSDSD